MEIVLPGGDRVDALSRGKTITTRQDGSAPAPFELFIASIGTCSGIYVAEFCQNRNIPTDDIRILLHTIKNPETRMIERIEMNIRLPEDFPPQYRDAVVRSAQLCAVKKHLDRPPEIGITTTLGKASAS